MVCQEVFFSEIFHEGPLQQEAEKKTNNPIEISLFPVGSPVEKIMNKLLSADPTRIGRPDVPPTSDAVAEERLGGTPDELKTDLIWILGEDLVRHRISDLVRYASDASPYRYIPTVIVQPKNIDHVAAIFRYCIRKGGHATFRAGGTSLNGQSQGDDL